MRDIGPVHHIGITVSNLDRSVAFYQALGLELGIVAEGSGDRLAAMLNVPGASLRFAFLASHHLEVELLEYTRGGGDQVIPRNCDVGASHLCWLVDDIGAAMEELSALGIQFPEPPITVESGPLAGCQFVYFRDPDGYQLELFQSTQEGMRT